MKIKVSEATPLQLDWLAAKCEGEETHMHHGKLNTRWSNPSYSPTTNWAQGGPIIEREKISPRLEREGLYFAPYFNGVAHVGHQSGPTPLIAAMRCYVASKLGDEVEVPDELSE